MMRLPLALIFTLAACGNPTLSGERSTALPDLTNSSPGRGFPITGLAVAQDGSLWAGTAGRRDENDDREPRPSLVNFDATNGSVRREIALPWKGSVQGVALQGSCVFAVLPDERALARYCPSSAPVLVKRFNFVPNALISIRGRLAVSDRSKLRWVSDGRVAMHAPILIDHATYADGLVWIVGGANGQPAKIAGLSVLAAPRAHFSMPGARASEGIAFRDGKMLVANNAHFHRVGPKNEIIWADHAMVTE